MKNTVKNNYSREEVEEILANYADENWAAFSSKSDIDDFNNWVEQNL